MPRAGGVTEDTLDSLETLLRRVVNANFVSFQIPYEIFGRVETEI